MKNSNEMEKWEGEKIENKELVIEEQKKKDIEERKFEEEHTGRQQISSFEEVNKVKEELDSIYNKKGDILGTADAFPEKKNIIWQKQEKAPEKKSVLKKIFGIFNKRAMLRSGLTTKIITAPTIAAAISASPGHAPIKSPDDSTSKNKIENTRIVSDEDSLSNPKGKIEVYKKAKTKAGATTPTGYNNSFLENEDNLSQEDLLTVAKKYGFRTGSAKEFQSDLVDYIAKNRPEIIQHINEKYGRTALGLELEKEEKLSPEQIDIEGLKDGNLGVRTKKIIEALYATPETSPTSPETIDEQPKGGYVINVRGDEHNQQGVYYFFENEKDFMEATNKIGGYSSREVYADGTGQASINMNADVYKDFHAREKMGLLGQGWLLDNSSPGRKHYKKLSTNANYSEGLANK